LSGIERFDFSRVISDEDWNIVAAMLDKKSLMFFEEISAPLQQIYNSTSVVLPRKNATVINEKVNSDAWF